MNHDFTRKAAKHYNFVFLFFCLYVYPEPIQLYSYKRQEKLYFKGPLHLCYVLSWTT